MSPCRLWRGARTKDGYGGRYVNGRFVYVHREALERKLGRPIRPGMVAAHRCHVRHCRHPGHLVECTQGDNIRMSVAAGRFRRETPNPRTRAR